MAADELGLRIGPLPRRRQATALSPQLSLSADRLAHAVVETTGETPELALFFLWRRPGRASTGVRMQWSGPGLFSVRLRGLEEWDGSIEQVGVGVQGPLEPGVWIRSLTLTPPDRGSGLKQLVRDWTAFEGLRGYSMNFVRGHPPHVPRGPGPVPSVALWLGLAIGIHLLTTAWRRGVDGRVVAAVLATGWLLLDLRWQVDLTRQLASTRSRYQGRSWSERQELAEDGRLFQLAQRVTALLPAEPQDLFVLTREPSDSTRFLSIRMRYLLLPHRARVSRPTPPLGAPRGSYVLVFEPRGDVAYDEATGRLTWRTGTDGRLQMRRARRLQGDSDISLYRLE